MADFSVTKVHDKTPMTSKFDHLTISKDAWTSMFCVISFLLFHKIAFNINSKPLNLISLQGFNITITMWNVKRHFFSCEVSDKWQKLIAVITQLYISFVPLWNWSWRFLKFLPKCQRQILFWCKSRSILWQSFILWKPINI